MKSRYLDFMQKRCAALVCAAIAAFAVAGCVTFGGASKEPSQSAQIVEMTKSNNAVVLRQLDLQMEREKTRRAEIEGENAIAGAIMRIAEGGSEHAKVNGQTALLGVAKSRGKDGAAAAQAMPQLPPQQAIQPERDWLDRTLQIASVVMPGGVPAVLSPVLAFRGQVKSLEAQTAQAKISGETQQALYGVFRDINGNTVAGIRDLGISGFNVMGASATAFGAKPTYQITVNGDDNALFGSTTSRTIKVDCPLVADARSGTAGTGGNGANGGQGGNSAGAGPAGSGASGGAGAPGGTSGTAMQTSNVNCIAGK